MDQTVKKTLTRDMRDYLVSAATATTAALQCAEALGERHAAIARGPAAAVGKALRECCELVGFERPLPPGAGEYTEDDIPF